MNSFRRLVINGKFRTRGPTAVHAVAERLIHQLGKNYESIAHLFEQPPVILTPPRSTVADDPVFKIETAGLLQGQIWEQVDLAGLTQSDLLLNLCNLGPVMARNAITMIHDAQVFSTPSSYGRGFGLYYRAIQPMLGRRNLRILTISDYSADQLVHYGVAERTRLRVVPNGVDHILETAASADILSRLKLDKRGYVFGLANLQTHKNIGLLLEAFRSPALADLRLVLVGHATRARFEEMGLQAPANVMFTGYIDEGELRALLEGALCVGFPSKTEGFGLPPLEGMRLGCPAVVAPCGALPELCLDAAIYAAEDRPEPWVQAFRRLADDPDHWSHYSACGIERAKALTWAHAGAALIDVIRDVAGSDQKKA